ncbi:MAG: hypothetical protein L0177_20630 [Chloroflexi bacterium]|nr:hypothetical protein [Chloroflexota bacterium]
MSNDIVLGTLTSEQLAEIIDYLRSQTAETKVELRFREPSTVSLEFEMSLASLPAYEIAALSLASASDALIRDFEGLPERLAHHASLIDQSYELLKLARSMNRNLKFAVLTLHDALRSVYSEKLTLKQANVIKEAVRLLQTPDWDEDGVRQLSKMLLRAGFETVPSDKSLPLSNAKTTP